MGKYVNRITHKGKEILFLDAANKGEEEILAAWEEAKHEVAKELNGCLGLCDATNCRMTLAITNKARETAAAPRLNSSSQSSNSPAGSAMTVRLSARISLSTSPSTGVRGVGFAALTYGQKATSDPAQVYTAVFGAAVLGLVMFGFVVIIEAVMMRNRPQEAIG